MKATSSAVSGLPSAQVHALADLDRVGGRVGPRARSRRATARTCRPAGRTGRASRTGARRRPSRRSGRAGSTWTAGPTACRWCRASRSRGYVSSAASDGDGAGVASADGAADGADDGAADGDAPPPHAAAAMLATASKASNRLLFAIPGLLLAPCRATFAPWWTTSRSIRARGTPPTVDCRMTSSVGRITRRGPPSRSATSWSSVRAASAPCSRTFWRMVVRGGSRWAANSRSSKPAECDVVRDAQAARRGSSRERPRAVESLAQKMASTPMVEERRGADHARRRVEVAVHDQPVGRQPGSLHGAPVAGDPVLGSDGAARCR